VPRVVVAMSGGVDSSVAAALLVEQGFEVIGMMMRLWSEETVGGRVHNRCCTPDQMADARRIASKLGIPFHVLDTREVFHDKIVDFFVEGHRQGVTPMPCMECNRHIRFDWLLQNALALDADFLATGHYARIERRGDRPELRVKRDGAGTARESLVSGGSVSQATGARDRRALWTADREQGR
jgi:tRNA-specific 2-thiouridylase